MSNIVLIKEPGILRDGIQKVLQQELPRHKLTTYGSRQLHSFYGKEQSADLIVIDMDSDINAFELIKHCLKLEKRVAVWVSEVENETMTQLFQLGLLGYFFNGMESTELIYAINNMLENRRYIHPHLSPILLDDYLRITYKEVKRPNGILTEREWEILEQIVRGNQNEKIAENLFISSKTVKNHVISILKKLHVTNRTNAALVAIRNKWFVV
ncbi:response regulator transcription factor [Lentibacillus cibarius]|uniref:Response regulator transcription factor n=1 Tax=Lentibacillus cibarius TaxID=2583219 RepID=A0A549YEF1_9BACI|nr:response regulator transcription factor [Lentibacillus cibarius]TMN21390.1 response regulator transcription factor [Lentibacillus cibarius]TRM10269.1 response regulator transcription factor [Lentibacillus cibarius]